VPNTALHRVLGIRNRSLQLEDIRRVVDDRIQESETLDWKRKLPVKADVRDDDLTTEQEFAKDVAAMANSGGGTIVFGIEEDRRTSAAEKISGAGEWNDGVQRTLRSWVTSQLQPPIYDFLMDSVGDGSETVVILHVPASAQAPHFLSSRKNIHRVPKRAGTMTVFMTEREVEAAYRARFREQGDRQKALDDLWELATRWVLGKDITVAAVARPLHGRQPHLGRVTREEMHEILKLTTNRNRFLVENMDGSPFLDASAKRGLRLWRQELETMFGSAALIEVHDDGTLLLAWQSITANGLKVGEEIDEYAVHRAPAYFAQLIESASEVLGVVGDFEVKLGFATSHGEMLIRQVKDGEFIDRSHMTKIYDLEPVDAIFTASDDYEVLVEQVYDLALDLLNSGGITRVRQDILRSPTEG
jgi:hypothetical protein